MHFVLWITEGKRARCCFSAGHGQNSAELTWQSIIIVSVVRFSSDSTDDNEEFLVLPVGSSQINVSQYIYEMIILSLPIKIIHPGVEDGTLKSKTLTMLRDYEKNIHKTDNKIDPRWDKLKDLI